MVPELVRVRPGPTATDWLARRIRAAQADDPLHPVTVVVPTHHAGLHLRRRLAAGGYANVRFTVVGRLAESLGAARLAAAGRAPLTAVTRAALVRGALRAAGGSLAPSADHAGLVDLVARLAGELGRRADPVGDAARIEATGTATSRAALQAVAEYERGRAAAGLYDDVDLLESAASALRTGDVDAALRDLGTVVVHLPARLDRPDAGFLRALAARAPVLVALPDLGEEAAGPSEAVSLLGGESPTPALDGGRRGSITALVAPDPVEEVRAAVRGALAAAERADPVPLHRTAIVFRDEAGYGTLLRDTLDEAGVPYASLDGRPLSESVAGRGLLGLIRLRDEDLTRAAVLGWLSGLPHRGGVLRSQARWDQLSRDAGVVRGAHQWRDRLAALAEARTRTLAHLEASQEDPTLEAHVAAVRRDIEDARRIAEHVAAIDEATRPPEEPTWQAHVAWALRLRDEFLTPDDAWSAEDREASQAVEEAVRALGAAQAIEPAVQVGTFRRALEDGLRTRRRPEGRMGRGVVIGPHRLLLGMDAGRVHVLGALEAGFPPPPPVDPLLAGDPLDRQVRREQQERGDWLATLAAADGGEALVSAPVVDAEGRAAYPSPWLLETLAGDGHRLRASEVRSGAATHPRLHRVRTEDGAVAAVTPLSLAERREAEAVAARNARRDLLHTALGRRGDLPFHRAVEVTRARRSPALTEFDGNVAAVAHLGLVARGLGGAPQSATGIETWATCPFHFLLGRVLAVSRTEDADDERWWQIDAAERGILVHGILERFFGEVARTGRPAPGTPYTDEDVRHVEALATDAFREAEARGVVGHPLVWANERAAILADLRTLLREDADQRAEGGWRPAYLEQPFGFDGSERSWPAVTVPLGGGREMRLRGYIDRVDLDEEGRARVIDYKTGRWPRTAIGVENLLDSGRRLQLPIYGRAVRDRSRARGLPAPAATSLYWYATVRGEFRQTRLEVDDGAEAVLTEVLSRIDAGVRAGCFPQVPGDYEEWWGRCQNCSFCDYDSLCPAGRDVLAAAKAESPALAPHRALRPAMVEDGA